MFNIGNYFYINIVIFIKLLILFLILTIVIATITLVERKVLSLVQRRVGPQYVGYKGRFQFIADALKFLVKHILIINNVNRLLILSIPALVLVISYLFWINLVWGPNLSICEIEYNLFFMGVISILFSFLLILVGWLSISKYAILSSNRIVVISLNLEILLNFFIIILLIVNETLAFTQISSLQDSVNWHFLTFLPILPLLIITFLLETSRIPFDLAEAESELVAGFTVEYGGFFFALFYLGEYFHLYCFSAVFTLTLVGGWI